MTAGAGRVETEVELIQLVMIMTGQDEWGYSSQTVRLGRASRVEMCERESW